MYVLILLLLDRYSYSMRVPITTAKVSFIVQTTWLRNLYRINIVSHLTKSDFKTVFKFQLKPKGNFLPFELSR